MDIFNPSPPAHVREADSLLELARTCNNALHQGLRASQAGIDSFREAGEVLIKAKAKLDHGKWQEWVSKNIQCSDREVRRYMRLAREWQRLKTDTVSVLTLNQAMTLLVEEPPPDPDTPVKQLFCPDCQRTGPKRDCPKCEAVRATAAKAETTQEREPGDDTESEAAAKKAETDARRASGQVAFDKKQFGNEFGALLREIDRVGNAYKIKETPEAEALRKSLDDWRKAFLLWVTAASKRK